MSSDYNYNLLKKDIKEGKQIVLFVGAGINFCPKHRMLWSDIMRHLFKHALTSIACNKDINKDDLAQLKELFGIDNNALLDKESIDSYLELYEYVQDEYPSVLQAYIVKRILGQRYISIIQEFLYKNCSTVLLREAFETNHSIKSKEKKKEIDYPCLFAIARLILLCPNIKAVVTYNYDNFLTQAIKILQESPGTYFNGKDKLLFNKRTNNGSLEVVDVYGDNYNSVIRSKTFPIYHVHGYIPSPTEIQNIDETSIVLSLDEFYDNVRNVYSWQTDTQMHLLSHYTCIFIGSSISDITIQRMLYYAQHYGNNENIYYFRAHQIKQQLNEHHKCIHKILDEIKNDFYNDYGLTTIYREDGYDKLYPYISALVDVLKTEENEEV